MTAKQEQALLIPEPVAVQPQAPTPMLLLQMAMQQGADLDKLTKLMDLQERWEASEARKAFVAAMAAFKANPPVLVKNKAVDFTSAKGRTHYKHATLDHVADAIGKELSKYGLSFRWNVEQAAKIRVTCILQHSLGHSESVTLEAPPDATGNKNTIQEIGSTVTYLQRYTLLASTGMATADQDTDGITYTDEMQDYLSIIKQSATTGELDAAFKEAYKHAKDTKEKAVYIDAREARRKELQ